MGKYTFKDEYYYDNISIIKNNFNVRYYSPIVRTGSGSKESPSPSYAIYGSWGEGGIGNLGGVAHIFGDGYHTISYFTNTAAASNYFIGNDTFRTTYLDGNIAVTSQNYPTKSTFFKDLSLDITITNRSHNSALTFFNCCIYDIRLLSNVYIAQINNCVLYKDFLNNGSGNSYVGISSKILINNNLSLLEKSNVIIDQNTLNSYVDLYFAFNDCNFKIGSETEFLPLSGTTEEELRADFVRRCDAQGLTCPTKSEYGETIPMYRWVFAKNSSFDGVVLKNSIIHNFEKRRLIYFGYTSLREGISVNQSVNIPNSISVGNPNRNIRITDNAAQLPERTDITKELQSMVQSNICWLGGLKQLTRAEVIHNFNSKYGLAVDTSANIEHTPVSSGEIEPGVHYVVRSADANLAEISYEGVDYTSSLSTGKNIFLGVLGQTEFSGISPNARVYKLIDTIQYRHINMRIANKIPEEKIKTGNLLNGYWYLVEHDADQSNTSDYVTYQGVNYPPLSSFLADSSNLTFTTTGNIHLRRCWKDNFDFETETIDKSFWANEQKPNWFKVVGSDLRCLMKNNTGSENEIQTDDKGDYITSGHPAFYPSVSKDSGVRLPAFNIKGAYYQVQLEISTLNPM